MKKKRKTQKQIKKELKIMEYCFYGFAFLLALTLSFVSAWISNEHSLVNGDGENITASLPQHNMVISYEGLTKDEINRVNDYINDLDPIYLTDRQREIRFVSNISEYCDDCYGINYNDGELMVILVRESESETRYTLCHELLHSYVYGSNEVEEPIVRDLSASFRCYLSGGARR